MSKTLWVREEDGSTRYPFAEEFAIEALTAVREEIESCANRTSQRAMTRSSRSSNGQVRVAPLVPLTGTFGELTGPLPWFAAAKASSASRLTYPPCAA
jgi:hypothetical protein